MNLILKGLLTGLVFGLTLGATAQSFCSSDGQATPLALHERFINAECDTCWGSPDSTQPASGTLTLDWIVPSARGDDAPLSAAATRDALARLEVLGRAAPRAADMLTQPVRSSQGDSLRVAHGVALGGYVGASIEFKPGGQSADISNINTWLALVETIAAGTDGTLVERNLIRNVLWLPWDVRKQLSKDEQSIYRETRPMSIPSGSTPERLRVVGWVENARGQVLTASQSVCVVSE
jgi:hypothetical protein